MHYIEEQLTTILQQQNVNVTIFISVDQSTDGTEVWLKQFALQEPRVKLLPFGEKFGGAAKNFFRLIRDVDFSTYNFIAFADQDDHWYLSKLAHACSKLKNSEFSAYSSNVLAFWPNGKQLLINKAQPQKKWDHLFEAAGPGCTYVMTVELMSAIKTHLIKNWHNAQQISLHDWFCYAFARTHNYQWFIDSTPSMLYRQHESNQVGVNKGFKAYINRFKQITNGWWFKQILLLTQIMGISNTPFVKCESKLKRFDYLRLARHARQCRRDTKECFVMLSICIFLALKN